MWRGGVFFGLFCLIFRAQILLSPLIEASFKSGNEINKDDGTHIMSLTMCLAQISGMNDNYTLREVPPVRLEPEPQFVRQAVPTLCPDSDPLFRTADGFCNNIKRPSWGQSLERFKRYVDADYADGIGAPRIYSTFGRCSKPWFRRLKPNKCLLPSARTVSINIHPPRRVNSKHSVMLMQWGQFLDHDFTASAIQQPEEGVSPCCDNRRAKKGKLHPHSFKRNKRCFPISIKPRDRFFKSKCLDFVRSRAISPRFNRWNPREQQNLLTSFVDGSNVYGSDQDTQDRLRGVDGRMKTSDNNLLPRGRDEDCIRRNAPFCFDAGDERVHVFPGLTALHTAFVRYHNYIVDDLKQHNTRWDGERLFQETRKIISALLQRITYTEFLPEVLSDDTLDHYNLKEGNYEYSINVNPSIAGAFATAAFRFGHTLIPDFLVIDGKVVKSRRLFNNPEFIFTSLKSVVENILSNPAQMRDRFLSKEIVDHLFETEIGSFDLAAFNIQRGRDHGLPSYNTFRRFCNLPEAKNFNSEQFEKTARKSLRKTYRTVDDIDLFSGGMAEQNEIGSKTMAEQNENGSILGPLFNCILGKQFSDLKCGDSFWYETTDSRRGFSKDQLKAIKNVSLSQILCQVFSLAEIQRNPFRLPGKTVKCKKLSELDLSPWYE
ncbi:eosinophil peroxidase [Patella vulgata]|uniref:eosinophil peroxidase n=1 Tax=Patella vulgata TaxID=6465 RepID=UPI00217FCBA7|nr:eosinophil peroxidase [Patella vulgata]